MVSMVEETKKVRLRCFGHLKSEMHRYPMKRCERSAMVGLRREVEIGQRSIR